MGKHDDVGQAGVGQPLAVAVLIARRTRRLRALAIVAHEPGHEIGDIVRVGSGACFGSHVHGSPGS
jgi:hypothetical protein